MSGEELEQLHTSDDFGRFFKSWIRDPVSMGAFAPSGKTLARLMAKGVGPGARVVELGAGTGTVTAALLANGVDPKDLWLVERDLELLKVLRRRFPRCRVMAADALEIEAHFEEPGTFDFVISGLPLVLFSTERRRRLVEQAFALLKPKGRLHQFTYAGRCPIDRDLRHALRVQSVLLGIAPLNLPPGFVYRLERAA